MVRGRKAAERSAEATARSRFAHRLRRHAPAIGLGIVWLVLAIVSSYAVRLDYGPDEPRHMQYVHVLAREARLPGPEDTSAGHHGPVPYALLAVFYRVSGCRIAPLSLPEGPTRLATFKPEEIRARRILRLVCVLEALAALVCVYWFAVLFLKESRVMPLLITGIVGFNPMYTYLAGVVNNEQASILLSTVASGLILLAWRESAIAIRRAFWLGLLCGLGLWIKQTTLFIVPLALYTICRLAPRGQRLRQFGALAAPFCAIGIWWPLHHILAGRGPFPNFMPVPEWQHAGYADLLSEWVLVLLVMPVVISTSLLSAILPDWTYEQFKHVISKQQCEAVLYALLGLVALAYAVFAAQTSPRPGKPARTALPLVPSYSARLGLAALCIILAGIIWFAFGKDVTGLVGGRYVLNAALWAALILVGALERWVLIVVPSRRAVEVTAWVAVVILVVLDAFWVRTVIAFY